MVPEPQGGVGIHERHSRPYRPDSGCHRQLLDPRPSS